MTIILGRGTVYREDTHGPFGRASGLVVSVVGHPDLMDKNVNDDGVYYLAIPSDMTEFRLAFAATGYWSEMTGVVKNKPDPLKMPRISLQKKDILVDVKDVQRLQALVDRSHRIYEESKSPELRTIIKDNFAKMKIQLDVMDASPELKKVLVKELKD